MSDFLPRVSSLVNCGGSGREDEPGRNRRLVRAGSLPRLALEESIVALDHGIGSVLYTNPCGQYVLPGVFPKNNGDDRLMWVHQMSLAIEAGLPIERGDIAKMARIHHAVGQDLHVYLGALNAYPGDRLAWELKPYRQADRVYFDATYNIHRGDATDARIQWMREAGQEVFIEPGMADDGREQPTIDGTARNDGAMDKERIRLELGGDITPLATHETHVLFHRDLTADELVQAWQDGYHLALRLSGPQGATGQEAAAKIRELHND